MMTHAQKLYEVAPWRWLTEKESFAIRDPESGTHHYCQIIGTAGQVLAINFFPGETGLHNLKSLQSKKFNADKMRTELECLQLSYEDRADLEDWDAEVLQALSLRFRGEKAWPQIRSYRPGFFPWAPDRRELEILNRLLPPAIQFLEEVATEPRRFFPLGTRMSLIQQEGEIWTVSQIAPEGLPAPGMPAAPLDEIRWRRLTTSARKEGATWDVGAFPLANPVMEGERPYFPFIVLCFNAFLGKVLGFQLTTRSELPLAVPGALAKVVEETGELPLVIQVEDSQLQEWLGPVVKAVGIDLRLEKTLRSLRELRNSMRGMQ